MTQQVKPSGQVDLKKMDRKRGNGGMKTRRKLGISSPLCARNVRVVLMGQDGVGKSALTVRLLTRRYIGEYDRTLEATYRHHLATDQGYVSLDVMDTAGLNTREKLDFCLAFGEIYIVLYSIIDKTSFYEASGIARFICEHKHIDSSSLVLLGTKQDLEHLRDVPEPEARSIADELNCSFYEISISEGFEDTLGMFHVVMRNFLNNHPMMEPMSPMILTSPTQKNMKSPSSWSKVKGLGAMPFRKKSVQAN